VKFGMHVKSMNASQFAVTGNLQPVLGHILPVASSVREEESQSEKIQRCSFYQHIPENMFYYFVY